jgi:hypothetical protein
MSLLNLNLPIIGGTNANEDPKIRTALSDIQTVVNALDDANIAPGADINGSKLDDATVSTAKLAANSVETAKIATDAVTNDKIDDDAVDTAQIADDAVENAQIADDAVDTAQIADGAVETAQLEASAVTDAKLATNAVTTSKILDGAVTAAKVAGPLGAFMTPAAGVSASGTRPAFARRYSQGLVALQGRLEKDSGLWTTPSTIGSLPANFRPSYTITLLCQGYNSGGGQFGIVAIGIQADGTVLLNSTSSPFVDDINVIDFDGIAFHAA